MRVLLLSSLLVFLSHSIFGQKVLQIERYGKAQTEKIYIGDEITYKLKNEEDWNVAVIEDLIIDQNLISLPDRFIKLDNIEAFRYYRPWTKAFRLSTFWFGTGWSAFAAIGTATDGNPDTSYRWSDAIVTGASWLSAWIVPQIFKYKVVKFGKRKRLRMLDISFKQGFQP